MSACITCDGTGWTHRDCPPDDACDWDMCVCDDCKGTGQRSMRFAYADPPYLSGAHRYKDMHPEWHVYASVDGHKALIERLLNEYPDGWVLSMGTPDIHHLAHLIPSAAHWCAWVKPWSVFRPNVNPSYSWEPVVLMGGRKRDRTADTVRDFTWPAVLPCNITLKKGLVGAKPEAFCRWVLDLLGREPGDVIDDLFPGTGVMGRVADMANGRTPPTDQLDMFGGAA